MLDRIILLANAMSEQHAGTAQPSVSARNALIAGRKHGDKHSPRRAQNLVPPAQRRRLNASEQANQSALQGNTLSSADIAENGSEAQSNGGGVK